MPRIVLALLRARRLLAAALVATCLALPATATAAVVTPALTPSRTTAEAGQLYRLTFTGAPRSAVALEEQQGTSWRLVQRSRTDRKGVAVFSVLGRLDRPTYRATGEGRTTATVRVLVTAPITVTTVYVDKGDQLVVVGRTHQAARAGLSIDARLVERGAPTGDWEDLGAEVTYDPADDRRFTAAVDHPETGWYDLRVSRSAAPPISASAGSVLRTFVRD